MGATQEAMARARRGRGRKRLAAPPRAMLQCTKMLNMRVASGNLEA
jgi:hypothetical protein